MSEATFVRTLARPGAARIEPGSADHRAPWWSQMPRTVGVTQEDIDKAEAWYARHANYVPPKGHATWCQMQLPSWWRPFRSAPTPMADPGCTCARNALAKRLRKLEGVMRDD